MTHTRAENGAANKRSVSLRTRILLIVYIMTTVIFWLCAWQFLRLSYNLLMESTFESVRNDQYAFGESLKSYVESLGYDKTSSYIQEDIQSAIKKHTVYRNQESYAFQIKDRNGILICSNMSVMEAQLTDLSPPLGGEAQYCLKQVKDRNVVFVSSYISLYKSIYRLDYVKDFTTTIHGLRSLAWQIAIVLFVSTLFLLLLLYFGIKKALSPLMQFGKQAQAISKGNYDLRVTIVYNDEVGLLAGDFNEMVGALQEHIHMLFETVRLRELFAANFAHELKTPLTSIIGYSEIAGRTEPEGEKLIKIHNYIKNEGKRLDSLSEKLLSWSRITQTGEIEIRECDSKHIIEHIQHSLHSILESKFQNLLIQNETVTIYVDETLFISLIVNLCSNASKASEPEKNIELFLGHGTDGGILLKVTDQGVGIEQDELDKLLEPFYMVDKARDRSKGGTGLGLTLCDVIVKAHQGSMKIDSKPGLGTCVVITIPSLKQ